MRNHTLTAVFVLALAALFALPAAAQSKVGQITKAIGDWNCLIEEIALTRPDGVVETLVSGVDPDNHRRLEQEYSSSDGLGLSFETICEDNKLAFRAKDNANNFSVKVGQLVTQEGNPTTLVRQGKEFYHAVIEFRFNDQLSMLTCLIPTQIGDKRRVIIEPEKRLEDFIGMVSTTEFGSTVLYRAADFVLSMPSTPVIDVLRNFLAPYYFAIKASCGGSCTGSDVKTRSECNDCCDDCRDDGYTACGLIQKSAEAAPNPSSCSGNNQAMGDFLICNEHLTFGIWDWLVGQTCKSGVDKAHKVCGQKCDNHPDLL
jgi:hypothetical protein